MCKSMAKYLVLEGEKETSKFKPTEVKQIDTSKKSSQNSKNVKFDNLYDLLFDHNGHQKDLSDS